MCCSAESIAALLGCDPQAALCPFLPQLLVTVGMAHSYYFPPEVAPKGSMLNDMARATCCVISCG